MRRLECCWFPDGKGRFAKLAAVMEFTARRHLEPLGWRVNVERISPTLRPSPMGVHSHSTNTAKLEWWCDRIRGAPDGDEILLVDADGMILRPLDEAWAKPFDVAYTVKDKGAKFPFNGGVVFIRVSDKSRAFIERWRAENAALFDGDRRKEHQHWRSRFGGINQASWGMLLEEGVPAAMGVDVAELPCSEWNCEDTYWGRAAKLQPRIVHIKSRLREALFLNILDAETRPLVEMWKRLDKERAAPQAPSEATA